MKIKSALMTQASGSIAGMTASRNRGGMYLRGRVVPVNPNTERQGIARANMGQATGLWSNELSQAQRDGWIAYAAGTPVTDRLGDPLILTGQQMFTRCTLPRLIAGLAPILAAPVVAGLATTPTGLDSLVLTDGASLGGTIAVEGSGVTGDLAIYMTPPGSPSRTNAHNQKTFVAVVGPPVAGAFTVTINVADLPYAVAEGQSTRVLIRYLDDEGRVSAEAFRDLIVAPGA